VSGMQDCVKPRPDERALCGQPSGLGKFQSDALLLPEMPQGILPARAILEVKRWIADESAEGKAACAFKRSSAL